MLRPATAARLLLGVVGLLATRRVLPLWGADPCSDRILGVARVLAARHLTQGVVLTVHPTRRTRMISAAVDFLHAFTMVALAAGSRRYRRPAATSACVALTFAGLSGLSMQPGRKTAHKGSPHRRACDVIPLRAVHTESTALDQLPRTYQAAHPAPRPELLKEVGHDRAAWLTHRTEDVLRSTTHAPMRSMSKAAAVVLLGLGVWLLFGQWVLNLPFTGAATTTGTRDEGFAVVVTLAGLRLLLHGGRSITASAVAILCGVLLVCSGVFFEHSATRAAVNEIFSGGIALLCAIASLDRWRSGARAAPTYAVAPGSL